MTAVKVKYEGRTGVDPATDRMPVDGIPEPWAPGDERVIDDSVARAAQGDRFHDKDGNPDGKAFAEFFVGYYNGGRSESNPLFTIEEAPTTDKALDKLRAAAAAGRTSGTQVPPEDPAPAETPSTESGGE